MFCRCFKILKFPLCDFSVWKNFRTAPYFIMHAHLNGDTLNNKTPM